MLCNRVTNASLATKLANVSCDKLLFAYSTNFIIPTSAFVVNKRSLMGLFAHFRLLRPGANAPFPYPLVTPLQQQQHSASSPDQNRTPQPLSTGSDVSKTILQDQDRCQETATAKTKTRDCEIKTAGRDHDWTSPTYRLQTAVTTVTLVGANIT